MDSTVDNTYIYYVRTYNMLVTVYHSNCPIYKIMYGCFMQYDLLSHSLLPVGWIYWFHQLHRSACPCLLSHILSLP